MARAAKTVAENRRARHEYFVDDVVEVGIELFGTEVKSLRLGHVNLRDSHAVIQHGECFLLNCHISAYEHGNRYNHDPYRTRKLLLHKKEIRELYAKVRQQGYTLVPLRVYFNERGRAKVELALARGKKLYDKRAVTAEREAARRIDRVLKNRR